MPGKKNLEIPVYAFLGFLESGKTTFIQDTLEEDYFNDGQKTLIIACEEGLEEYEDELLEKTNCKIIYVEEEEEFTSDFLTDNLVKYMPDRVIVEYNGMWNLETLRNAIEDTTLELFQTIVTMNAETFDVYMNNIRSLAVEMFKMAELVIINRCTRETPMATYRRSIKAVNRGVQVAFETADDQDDFLDEEMELPFDLNADPIEIEDYDYGVWFIDAMDHPENYDGKTIQMVARVYKSLRMPKGCFVPGRHAMTCCADDVQFLGYLCHTNHAKSSTIKSLKNKMWIKITADVKYEYSEEYGEEGPVLYAKRIEAAEQPEEELVYF